MNIKERRYGRTVDTYGGEERRPGGREGGRRAVATNYIAGGHMTACPTARVSQPPTPQPPVNREVEQSGLLKWRVSRGSSTKRRQGQGFTDAEND